MNINIFNFLHQENHKRHTGNKLLNKRNKAIFYSNTWNFYYNTWNFQSNIAFGVSKNHEKRLLYRQPSILLQRYNKNKAKARNVKIGTSTQTV